MNIIKNYHEFLPVISKTKLLNHIPVDRYDEVFQFLHATIRHYEKNEFIQRLGDPLLYSGIVLDGTIEGSFINENYSKINMNHFATGRSFGEALACVQTPHSPIQLKALTDCTVMFLDLKQILSEHECACAYQQTLSINLLNILASQNVFSNLKLRIANQKAIRDRVFIYLHSLAPDANGYIHIPFTQTAFAEFLGVNRSALSRELGRLQNEELLKIDENGFKLLL